MVWRVRKSKKIKERKGKQKCFHELQIFKAINIFPLSALKQAVPESTSGALMHL